MPRSVGRVWTMLGTPIVAGHGALAMGRERLNGRRSVNASVGGEILPRSVMGVVIPVARQRGAPLMPYGLGDTSVRSMRPGAQFRQLLAKSRRSPRR
jgi:hypothetical protein